MVPSFHRILELTPCTQLTQILSPSLHLGLPSGLFPSGFSTKTLYKLLIPKRATFPAHSILLDLITQTVFGKVYR